MNKEEFKEKLNIEEAIEKWSQMFGFNEDELIKNPRNVSITLEFCLEYLINEEEELGNNTDTSLIPAINRIFRNIEEDLSVDYLIDNTYNIINEFRLYRETNKYVFKYDNDTFFNNLDIEAVIISDFVDNYKLPEIN